MAFLLPAALEAQGPDGFIIPSSELPDMRHCTDTLVKENVSRVTIYQEAFLPDTTPAMVAQVDLIAQRIAATVRSALGAQGASVPAGDSLGMWLPPLSGLRFVVVLHRSGASTWHIDSAVAPIKGKLVGVYARALAAIPPDSLWMIWPDDYKPDSFAIRFSLFASVRTPHPRATSFFAVFNTNGIVVRSPALSHQAEPHFPDDANFHRMSGRVTLAFIVDSTGRADPQSIRVLEPTEEYLTTSRFAHFYREFVQVTRDVALRDRFTPARTGACAMKGWVQMPYSYDGSRLQAQ